MHEFNASRHWEEISILNPIDSSTFTRMQKTFVFKKKKLLNNGQAIALAETLFHIGMFTTL
jgi:hypothetical protein